MILQEGFFISHSINYQKVFIILITLRKKIKVMPPDIDRDPNKKYNTVNKYNLANPID